MISSSRKLGSRLYREVAHQLVLKGRIFLARDSVKVMSGKHERAGPPGTGRWFSAYSMEFTVER